MAASFKKWREAASLIIAAKTAHTSNNFNYKLLCLKRSSKSGFMPNTYVFPGGNISKSDSDPQWFKFFEKIGINSNKLKELYPKENIPTIFANHEDEGLPKYISLRICALRETFEECGILICRHKDSKIDVHWAQHIAGAEILEWQHKVHKNASEFINLCNHFDLVPDIWSLKLWSNWVTPPSMPSLFNTVFFTTTFKDMPVCRSDEKEIQDIKWCDPDEYLLLNKKEEVLLPPPQFYEMSRIRNFPNIEKFSQFIHDRSQLGCEMFFPYRIKSKQGVFSILPGDELYPKTYDCDNKQIPEIGELPDSSIKNRVLHESKYTNKLFFHNCIPKDGHLPPKIYSHL